MGSTLEHGIYLPSEGEKNCYSGLANNWQTVDTNIGYVTALRQAIAGALTRKIVTQLPTEDIDPNCIYMILKITPQTNNAYDEWMYINSNWELIGDTQLDLSDYYTKQEVNELPAVASGVTSTKVGNYDTHIADTNIHVTASDKTKWTNSANTFVLRLSKTALTPSSSTNAFSNLDDATALKVGDKVMDTAGVLFEVTAIDTANSTFTIGTSLIDLAQDSDVVHKSGNETITGEKTWNAAQVWYVNCQRRITSSIEKGEVPSTSQARNDYYTLKNGRTTYGEALGVFGCTLSDTNAVSTYFHAIKNVAGSSTRTTFSVNYYTNTNEKTVETNGNIIPTGSTQNLGNSTSKWATINGLNPSSLSLPDLDNGIDISSYIDVSQTSQYTAPADGYISICGYATSTNAILIKDHDYDFAVTFRAVSTSLGATTYFVMPVIKNHVYDITCSAVTTIAYAKFFPCQGNV